MKILLIGSGPIIVGQACEFDYAGTQACKALKEEGHEVILLNSNPASIMTDPENSDKTYIEEINLLVLEKIIELEKPNALLPTLGGQVALNLALEAWESGILEKNNVKLIGVSYDSIKKAEDRKIFKDLMESIGLETPKTLYIKNLSQINQIIDDMGLPLIIRSSFTLGGKGCYNIFTKEDLIRSCSEIFKTGAQSVQVEEYLVGWKEYELEVVRDKKDNCIVICSIENIDPMGIHTGDSITVVPAQTLSDKEYQKMREASFKIVKAVGVETGGANVQFGVNPKNGRMVVIEMNPRVSRSSALASKVTGYPIARIATKLALGYTLDELDNKLTGAYMPASFEPTIDYVVTKIPKFNFDKFPTLSGALGIKMQSIGEVVGVGRCFQESLLKAIYALEIGNIDPSGDFQIIDLEYKLSNRSHDRILLIFKALYNNISVNQICDMTKIDKWFLEQINNITNDIKGLTLTKESIYSAKRLGLSDKDIAKILNSSEQKIRNYRKTFDILPTYKKIDTCSAEFNSESNYLYSTYEDECESMPTVKKKVIIIGSGANRIGQGIEFDYSCVHAIQAAKELGYESIIINSNPATVSTDCDISDRLYLEPVTAEHVLNIIDLEKPLGSFFQFGGQTSINILRNLYPFDINVLGTSYQTVDLCEDRVKFRSFLDKLNIKQIKAKKIDTKNEIHTGLQGVTFPLIIRPSYIISGSSISIIRDHNQLQQYLNKFSQNDNIYPILAEEYIEGYKEVEIDGISDGENVFIAGIIEQIEPVGIHSGDSSCIFPSFSLSSQIENFIIELSKKLAAELNILGLFNIQFAVKDREVYVIEVNPRASRTIPYLSKALGVSLAKIATKAVLGVPLAKQGVFDLKRPDFYFMKNPVFSDVYRIKGSILGPEMVSTGEKMVIGSSIDSVVKKSKNLLVDPISLQEIYLI
jgi:carbamoyl-phosphate synthase large subunit